MNPSQPSRERDDEARTARRMTRVPDRITAVTAPAATPDRFRVLPCGADWGVYDTREARWERNYVGPKSRDDTARALPQIRQRADSQEHRAARTGRGER